jgi:hypothetical protein
LADELLQEATEARVDRSAATAAKIDGDDRRGAPRLRTPGLTAWISGPVSTPATVENLADGGARLRPFVPLRRHVRLRLTLALDGVALSRIAVVVYVFAGAVGVRFVDRSC